jgi:transposase-like protein
LSYRDIEELFREGGLAVNHATLNRWALAYAPLIERRLGSFRKPHCGSLRIDESSMISAFDIPLADRVETRCLVATRVLPVTEDHERHRVTPWIAVIDRVGALSGATRSVQPADQAQVVGLLSSARPSPPPSICQMRQG